ncbi:MAG: DJ-1/PfpI family protein, partial [Candidatus Omnitrophota bacterium]
KKAVMIIAGKDFRDEELFQPKKILEDAGISVKVASRGLMEAAGMLGGRVKPDLTLQDINMQDFDAIIFVGGIGASVYWDDAVAHKIARDAYSADKIVAAICIAPVTLAKAGLLDGKKATVWPSESRELSLAGADYTAGAIERDGNIITASGPETAVAFGREIVKALSRKE